MQTKNGFTLIEILFTLSLILLMSYFTYPKSTINLNHTYKILELIENAQSYALNDKAKVYLRFETNKLSIYTDQSTLNHLYLNTHEAFLTQKTLYFNEEGHINQAATIYYQQGNQIKSYIFNLGMGRFYLQELVRFHND